MVRIFYYICFMGSSTMYYRKMRRLARAGNAKAKAITQNKHNTDTKINAIPEQIAKRVDCNKKVAQAKKMGKNLKGLDYDHACKKFVSIASNRGRKGEGGRKKKSK